MKVLIDIDEALYNYILDGTLNEVNHAVKNGLVLDKATNGEVLCMLFPNMHYTLSDKHPRVVTTIGVGSSFDKDWWNALYKKSEDKE